MLLSSIIRNAYEQFSVYPINGPLDICTDCCMSVENERLLAGLPVYEIPKELLMEYTNGASSLKTPIIELKHFLPRYLELIGGFEFPSFAIEVTLRRLAPFKTEEWIEEELNLLDNFAIEFFRRCLSIYPLPNHIDIDEIIIMFWRGQVSLSSLLKTWENSATTESILHFKDLVFYGLNQSGKSNMNNAFADNFLAQLLKDWIESKPTRHQFAEAIENILLTEKILTQKDSDELELLYDILIC